MPLRTILRLVFVDRYKSQRFFISKEVGDIYFIDVIKKRLILIKFGLIGAEIIDIKIET
jgi:hypothetical protein